MAMNTGKISNGQLVPRPQPPKFYNSLGKVHSSGAVDSNSSKLVSFLNTRNKKDSALKMKAVAGNWNSQNFVEKKEKGIVEKSDTHINNHKNDVKGKETRILSQFNVGKKEFIIRS